jgi:hypothetical protein
MNRLHLLLRCLAVVVISCSSAEVLHGADTTPACACRLTLEPCASSLAGGKATLTTPALRREPGKYVGNYQLKVFPYVFKSESGTLSIGVSDESVRKLAAGTPVTFSGTAVTTGTGRTHPVTGIATPAGPGLLKGKVKITIATVNGALVFLSAYTLTGE